MRVELLTVPYDSGVRGSRMGAGPDALLASGLVNSLIALGHDVKHTAIELPDGLFLPEVQAAFELNRRLAKAVAAAVGRDAFPVVLSGNCITSLCGRSRSLRTILPMMEMAACVTLLSRQ